jgi:4-amino-4-deoxy-L-arabinose transferase-like glycosyltransferase
VTGVTVLVPSARLRSAAISRWGATFAVTAVAGIALRVWAYRAELGVPNADEAVVGLMVRHLTHGEFTTFYWGQAYGGPQEALLATPLFLIFGSSWLALRVIPIALNAVAALIVWRVGRRTLGEPAGAVAGALFWIWPPFNYYQLVHELGFYASDVVYVGLLLLLALRIVERPDRIRVGLFGLVLGLGFWQTAQIVPIVAGVVAWTVWQRPRALRHAWLAAALAVLGALPWIVWNARHSWHSLDQPPYGDYLRSLRLLASPILPMMVGLRAPFSAELLLPKALTYLLYVGLIALFLYGAVRAGRRPVSILYVVAAIFPWIYAISPKTILALGRPRYIEVLTPILALLLAQLARRWTRAVAVLAIACAVSIVTVYRMDAWFRGTPRTTTNAEGLGPRHAVQWVPRDLHGLISGLQALHLEHVYADYWLAYRLDFDSHERIVATESSFKGVKFVDGQAVPVGDAEPRFRDYERAVRSARHGFVFYSQIVDTVPIVSALEQHGYRRSVIGSYIVYAPG